MIEYTVKVNSQGYKSWHVNGKLHREDDPAVEYANGTKQWYINDKELTEEEFKNRQASCDGKEVVIDGKTYTLVLKQRMT